MARSESLQGLSASADPLCIRSSCLMFISPSQHSGEVLSCVSVYRARNQGSERTRLWSHHTERGSSSTQISFLVQQQKSAPQHSPQDSPPRCLGSPSSPSCTTATHRRGHQLPQSTHSPHSVVHIVIETARKI